MPSNDRPNLLYLVHRLPYPPDKGDRIRAFQLLRYLSQRANIHLASLADEPATRDQVIALESLCVRVAVVKLGFWRWARALVSLASGGTISEGAFSSPELRTLIGQWTRDLRFDACVVSASSLVPYLRLPELRKTPAVVDLVDVDSQKWLDYAGASAWPRSWLYGLEGRRLRQLEADLPAWTRGVTLVSEAEAALYRQFCTPGRVEVVTNGVDFDYFAPQPQGNEAGCAFLGALDYRPNVDGLVWFCNEVWPAIRKQRPEAVLRLVGRRPVPAVQRLAQIPGVELVGQVADVRPYLAQAAIAVVPLQIARGVQNKILESMAMGKATIISPSCMKGLRAVEGKHVLVASSAEEWLTCVVRLLDDADLRQQLGDEGRRYVVEEHRWDQCLEPLDTLLDLRGVGV